MASSGAGADELGAEQLKAALAASMAARDSGKSKLDITAEEATQLQQAFEKPEFRTLFKEYLQEISDPKNKKEYDDYLQSLEDKGQLPDNVNLVRPTAGFCVKAKTKPSGSGKGKGEALPPRKVFVNVCSSDEVDIPVAKQVTQGGRTGQSWSLPHFVGPQHAEQDKKGEACETFDVCYHPSALAMGEANPAFKDMLARTSLEAVVKAVQQVIISHPQLLWWRGRGGGCVVLLGGVAH
jgi:dynein assembly factor 2